jgi:hypothetical protein
MLSEKLSGILIQIFFPSRIKGSKKHRIPEQCPQENLRIHNTVIKEEKIRKKIKDEPYASPLGVSSLRERLGTGYP